MQQARPVPQPATRVLKGFHFLTFLGYKYPMLRSLMQLRSKGVLASSQWQQPQPAVITRAWLSNNSAPRSAEDLFKFVQDSLELKGIKGKAASDEVSKLKAHQIVSMDLLKGLNMHDWEKTGVSLGAARVIQDAIWTQRQNEVLAKMSLRRENSSKQELKQRRL